MKGMHCVAEHLRELAEQVESPDNEPLTAELVELAFNVAALLEDDTK